MGVPACPHSGLFPGGVEWKGEKMVGMSQLDLTSLLPRDLVSLGISSAEHREDLLSGIGALRARVLQLQGRGVQV